MRWSKSMKVLTRPLMIQEELVQELVTDVGIVLFGWRLCQLFLMLRQDFLYIVFGSVRTHLEKDAPKELPIYVQWLVREVLCEHVYVDVAIIYHVFD